MFGFFKLFCFYCKSLSPKKCTGQTSCSTAADSMHYLPLAEATIFGFLAPIVLVWACFDFLGQTAAILIVVCDSFYICDLAIGPKRTLSPPKMDPASEIRPTLDGVVNKFGPIRFATRFRPTMTAGTLQGSVRSKVMLEHIWSSQLTCKSCNRSFDIRIST
jgi:hypothetical protein